MFFGKGKRGHVPSDQAASEPNPAPQDGVAYRPPTIDDSDLSSNLEWNRQRWGQDAGWRQQDGFGYQWGMGFPQTVGHIASIVDEALRPHLSSRYDLKTLEISPGAGRFTAELIRFSSEMVLVDMNSAAIEVCQERMAYYPTEIRYFVNDGTGLSVVPDDDFELIASYDSMVHMHPSIVEAYLRDAANRLVPSGIIWFDHSGRGQRSSGHRTAVTAEGLKAFGENLGLSCIDQIWRNDWDCISVFRSDVS